MFINKNSNNLNDVFKHSSSIQICVQEGPVAILNNNNNKLPKKASKKCANINESEAKWLSSVFANPTIAPQISCVFNPRCIIVFNDNAKNSKLDQVEICFDSMSYYYNGRYYAITRAVKRGLLVIIENHDLYGHELDQIQR